MINNAPAIPQPRPFEYREGKTTTFYANFTSNGHSFTGISLQAIGGSPALYLNVKDDIRFFPVQEGMQEIGIVFSYDRENSPVWIDQAYRTITLDEPATGDFLTWLQANAVKQ